MRKMLRSLLFVLLALLVAGCIKADVSLTVDADGIVNGSVLIGYERTSLGSAGTDLADWQENFEASLEDPTGNGPPLDCEPWEDETYVGVDCQLTGATLDQVSAHDRLGGQLTLEQDGDEIHAFTMFDLSFFTQGVDNLDVQIDVTFPGPILRQTNGSVNERTVSWVVPAGRRTQIDALATVEATESDAPGSVPILAIGLGVAGLLVGVGVVVLIRRRRASPG
jgi:hypothetical protein